MALHDDLIVIDGPGPAQLGPRRARARAPDESARTVFADMRRGGLTAANASCSVWEGFDRTMRRSRSENLVAGVFRSDLPVPHRGGYPRGKTRWKSGDHPRLAKHVSGGRPDPVPAAVPGTRGARIVQMTYNTQNLVGSGCYETTDFGLSDFGRELIDELNRLRMLIDLSHVGPKTSDDTIRYSKLPVCYSHVAPRRSRITRATAPTRSCAHDRRARRLRRRQHVSPLHAPRLRLNPR